MPTDFHEGAAAPAPVLAGRYELSGVLGVGGMGSVYRALDRELDEFVALKVLRRELVTDPGMVERFRREVKLARRVTHTNVARVFDIGEHEGEKFITMELIDGESLGARIAREPRLSLGETVPIALAILAGLAAAHAAGVVHRDLKPDNVLVEHSGRVVLSDFGIARALTFGGQPSRTLGFVVGTPDYMAPEQIERALDVDGRADLYALGVMLFEMLTGEMPFKGESPLAILTARLVAPAPDPRSIMPDFPEAMASLILRLLARSPDARPATAREVAELLARVTVPADASSRRSLRPIVNVRAVRSIAVVPLATRTSKLAWLGYGLSELLADALDGRPGVDIRARGGRLVEIAHRELAELGDVLGVPLVIGGALEEDAAGLLRGTIRLLNARDGLVLWSTTFGEDARAQPLAFASLLADGLAKTLLLGARVSATTAADERAVSLCMRARYEGAGGGADGVDRAIALYEEAIARAPEDPWVNASYALALARRIDETELPGEADDVVSMARLAAERAPQIVAAHLALAEIYLDRGREQDAARSLSTARGRAPSSADVERLLGRLFIDVGEVDEGLELLRSAASREMPSWRATWDEARALVALGRHGPAEAAIESGADREPYTSRAWLARVRFAMWTGQREALEGIDRALAPAIVAEKALVTVVVAAARGRASLAAALAQIEAQARAAGHSRARKAFLCQLGVELALFVEDNGRAESLLGRSAADIGCDLAWLDHCSLLGRLAGTSTFAQARGEAAARSRSALALLRATPDTEPGNSSS